MGAHPALPNVSVPPNAHIVVPRSILDNTKRYIIGYGMTSRSGDPAFSVNQANIIKALEGAVPVSYTQRKLWTSAVVGTADPTQPQWQQRVNQFDPAIHFTLDLNLMHLNFDLAVST